MSTAEKRFISPQEYLAMERAASIRHEYYNGEMFAMAGATRACNLIAGNIFAVFRVPSLQDYVLVAQDKVHVEHFQRQPDGRWILEVFCR